MSEKRWLLNEIHPVFGKVVAAGSKDGEPWRMFKKDGTTSLIPFPVLNDMDELAHLKAENEELIGQALNAEVLRERLRVAEAQNKELVDALEVARDSLKYESRAYNKVVTALDKSK